MDIDIKANIIRDMIKHENELVNHRISWMSAMQALLFNALAFAWNSEKANLVPLLYIAGFSITIITLYSCCLAAAAIFKLIFIKDNNKYPPVRGLILLDDLFKFIKKKDDYSGIISFNFLKFFISFIFSPSSLICFVFLYVWFQVSIQFQEKFESKPQTSTNQTVYIYPSVSLKTSASNKNCLGVSSTICF